MTSLRVFAALLLLSPLARAHGAVPLSMDVFFADRGAGRQPFLATTYGLIYEENGRWVMACEESVSPGPKVWSVSSGGRFVMGHATGVSHSDDGCSYPSATGVPASVRALEQAPGDAPGTSVWWSIVDTFQPGRNLYRSTDGAETFELVPLPENLLANALRPNAAVPGALVVTAQDRSNNSYVLLTTADHGTHWTRHPMTPIGIPRVAAVSPSGTILVRDTVLDQASLHRSTDGGETFEKVLDLSLVPGAMTFLSDDVAWVAAGPGKTWRSEDGGATWTAMPDPGDLICLREEGDTLYACVNDRANNLAMKISTDDGQTWQPFLRWDEVVGMLACGSTTEGAVCEDYWLLSAIGMGIDIGNGTDAGSGGNEPVESCDCASGGLSALALLGLLRRRRARA